MLPSCFLQGDIFRKRGHQRRFDVALDETKGKVPGLCDYSVRALRVIERS
jgi:hypothetical protein